MELFQAILAFENTETEDFRAERKTEKSPVFVLKHVKYQKNGYQKNSSVSNTEIFY